MAAAINNGINMEGFIYTSTDGVHWSGWNDETEANLNLPDFVGYSSIACNGTASGVNYVAVSPGDFKATALGTTTTGGVTWNDLGFNGSQ